MGLKVFPNALKYLKRGELWLLELEYLKSNVVAEGLYDRLTFIEPAKLRCVDTLRQLLQVTDIKLFIRVTSDTFAKTLGLLKLKMRHELRNPPFQEYISKSGKYT